MSFYALIVVFLILASTPAVADPAANPPACGVELDRNYCARWTGVNVHPTLDGVVALQLEVVNWTGEDAYEVHVSLNTADGADPTEYPRFRGARIDPDGRPLFGPASPPRGNLPTNNDWFVTQATPTKVVFSFTEFPPPPMDGTPIPHPSADGYDGLLDPDFEFATLAECEAALTAMLPGSYVDFSQTPDLITWDDPETLDDGTNVRDGYVLFFENWDCGEEVSLNWQLWGLSDTGSLFPLGDITSDGAAVQGDEYGFGTMNLTRMCPGFGEEGPFIVDAPPPLFDENSIDPSGINTGYRPTDTAPDKENQTSQEDFAEDYNPDTGEDEFKLIPIPVGQPSAGEWFAVEPAAAIFAEFARESDNTSNSGTNVAACLIADDCSDGMVDQCGGHSNCLDCETPEGQCLCVDGGNIQCIDAIPCPNGTSDCPENFFCCTNTCCGEPVCAPAFTAGGGNAVAPEPELFPTLGNRSEAADE